MLKYKEFYLLNSKTVKFHHNKQENLEKILLSQYIHLYIHDSAHIAKAKITTCKQQIFVCFSIGPILLTLVFVKRESNTIPKQLNFNLFI